MGWRTYELEDKVARLEKQLKEYDNKFSEIEEYNYIKSFKSSEQIAAEWRKAGYYDYLYWQEKYFTGVHGGLADKGYCLEVEVVHDDNEDFYFEAKYKLKINKEGNTEIENLKQVEEDYNNFVAKYYPCGFLAYLKHIISGAIHWDSRDEIEGCFICPRMED